MAIMFFRLFYGLWVLGMILLATYTLSDFIFGRGSMRRKLKALGKRTLIIPIWPLMLFTETGRARLLNQLDNL